ncbi:hypothetical protein BKI52_20230 [marine bacterium AO1-C]|nr:hypothetical protein BKI52_20230 [marine bacterium AO1-C]
MLYKKHRSILIVYLLITLGGIQAQARGHSKFAPKLMAIMVKDVSQAIRWYQQKLGFEIDQPIQSFPAYRMKIALLHHHGFRLELIEKKGSMSVSALKLGNNHHLGGFLKMGFLVNNLEGLYQKLKKQQDVNFITGIGTLPKVDFKLSWPTKFLLIRDMDGNMLQFFSYGSGSQTPLKLTPWLVGITVKDLKASQNWYQNLLGFTFYKTVGKPGNRRAILAKNNFVIELFAPAKVSFTHTLKGTPIVLGFKKLAFGVDNFDWHLQKLRQEKASFFYGPAKSNSPWANQAMIVKDQEENLIQYFDLR